MNVQLETLVKELGDLVETSNRNCKSQEEWLRANLAWRRSVTRNQAWLTVAIVANLVLMYWRTS